LRRLCSAEADSIAFVTPQAAVEIVSIGALNFRVPVLIDE